MVNIPWWFKHHFSREIDLTKKKEPKKGKIGTQNRNKNTKEPKRMELVYLQQSPNYCEKDHLLGSLGKDIDLI